MSTTATRKSPIGFRLSDRAEALLLAISVKTGVNLTGVVELAIREKAIREMVTDEDVETAQQRAVKRGLGRPRKPVSDQS